MHFIAGSVGVLVLLAAVATAQRHDCATDVVFVIDNSNSVVDETGSGSDSDRYYDNWYLLRDWTRDVLEEVAVGDDHVRVGYVTFGDRAQHQFYLNSYDEKDDVLEAISSVQFQGGATNVYDALRQTRNYQFSEDQQRRTEQRGEVEVTKVVVYVTDGRATVGDGSAVEQAIRLKTELNVRILAVGVGPQASTRRATAELEDIASPPLEGQNTHLWQVRDFYELDSIRRQIANEICREQRNRENEGVVSDIERCPSGTRLDLTFLIDASDNIRDGPQIDTMDNWRTSLEFFSRLVGRLPVSDNEVRVSTVLYAETGSSDTAFDFEEHNNREDVQADVRGLRPLSGSSTNAVDGMEYINRVVYGTEYAPTGNKKVVIALLGNTSTEANEAAVTRQGVEMSEAGIEVITVGVGSGNVAYEIELGRLSPAPHYPGRNYFLVDYYDDLYSLIYRIYPRLCELGQTSEQPEPTDSGEEQEDVEGDCAVDLTFVVDSTNSHRDTQAANSMYFADWVNAREFTAQVVGYLDVDEDKVRVAYVTFAEDSQVEFNFDDYSDKAGVIGGILDVPLRGQEDLDVYRGLREARYLYRGREAREQDEEGEDHVYRTLIYLTDGRDTVGRRFLGQSQRLQEEYNVRILGVGHGMEAMEPEAEQELSEIVSPPIRGQARDFWIAENSANLQNYARELATEVCRQARNDEEDQGSQSEETSESEEVEEPQGGCRVAAEVVFVMDSGGVGEANFDQMKTWVGDIVGDLDHRVVNVGVVVYSSHVVEVVGFQNSSLRASELREIILDIDYTPGSTNTHDAIRHVYHEMLHPNGYARQNVERYMILVTNGGTRDPDRTLQEAFRAKAENIHMMVMAVEPDLDEIEELSSLASHPQSHNYMQVSSYVEMMRDRHLIRDAVCNNVDDCSSNPCRYGDCIDSVETYYCQCVQNYGGQMCERSCRSSADVVFLLDDSSSVGSRNFNHMLELVRNVVNDLPIGSGSRVALITVGATATVEFTLGRHSTKQQVLSALTIRHEGRGSSNLAAAIDSARRLFDASDMGNDRVIVSLMESPSDDPERTWGAARQARLDDNITIIAVGIGNHVTRDELESMASFPVIRNVRQVDDYETLFFLEDYLVNTICDNENECLSFPCQENGECMELRNGYTCECPDGFTGPNCERECDGGMDIAFMIDASSSVDVDRFAKIKAYVVGVIEQLEISTNRYDDKTHVACVTFGTSATLIFGLDDYRSKQDNIQAVNKIRYSRGKSNLAAALLLIRDTVFNEFNGDRMHKPNLLIIVTDGNSNVNDQLTVPESIYTRIAGVHIIVVTVEQNNQINMLEMRSLASMPESRNVQDAHNFTHIDQVVDETISLTCDDVNECYSSPCQYGGVCIDRLHRYQCECPGDRTGRDCQRLCHAQTDAAFLVDISGSLERYHEDIIIFLRLIVEGLEFNYGQNRIGLATFSDDANVLFHFDQFRNKDDILEGIAISDNGGRTNTQRALDYAGEELFGSNRGERQGVPHVVILVTDGVSNVDPRLTPVKAQQLKDQGVIIYVVVVGDRVDMEEVNQIASYTREPYVLRIGRYDDVYERADRLLDEICET